MTNQPGPIVLFGSGETSPTGRKIFESVFRKLPDSPQVVLLETPAGFEPNSDKVIGKVADFLRERLQNFNPQITIVPARHRDSAFSPDDPEIVEPILQADLIFLGPGSPTYAVRQLRDSLAWNYILARHRLGAALVFASAAAVAASTFALPVYEIYKVGEDLHWKPGLDLFGLYEIPLVFVPHWNNNDGGDDLDTSRCYMGRERFKRLMALLPEGMAVLGLDENTALSINPDESTCEVMGIGGVTILHTGHDHDEEAEPGVTKASELSGSQDLVPIAKSRDSHIHRYGKREVFSLEECCPLAIPAGGEGLPDRVWQEAKTVQQPKEPDEIPQQVQALLEKRKAAREREDWAAADELRDEINELGWQVQDTPDGQVTEKA